MTDHGALARVLVTALGASALWVYFYWIYRDYRRDLLRDRIFKLRAELFDMAADKKLAFDDTAYGLLRTLMNGFIRSSDDLTFVGFLAFVSTLGPASEVLDQPDSFEDRWKRALDGVSSEARKRLETIRVRLHLCVLAHVAATSLAVWITVVPLIALVFLKHAGDAVVEWCRPLLTGTLAERMDSAALAAGDEVPELAAG